MGSIDEITYERYPVQRDTLHSRVRIRYHYDIFREHEGEIIRDDAEEPYETIILLDNGRVLRGSECSFRLIR